MRPERSGAERRARGAGEQIVGAEQRADFVHVAPQPTAQGPEIALCQAARKRRRSEEHTSELQSRQYLVCRLLLEKKKSSISSCASGCSTNSSTPSTSSHSSIVWRPLVCTPTTPRCLTSWSSGPRSSRSTCRTPTS